MCAFCFSKHEIADCEFADFAILKCVAKIFRSPLSPACADLDVRAETFFRFDGDLEMIAGDVIADGGALIVCRSEQNIGESQIAH